MAPETPQAAPPSLGPQPTTVVPHYEHPPGYIPADQGRTNTAAIVSLSAGILSFIVLPLVGALVAIFTGHAARNEVKRTGQQGDGLALAGIILGYVHLGLLAVGIAVAAAFWFGLLALWSVL